MGLRDARFSTSTTLTNDAVHADNAWTSTRARATRVSRSDDSHTVGEGRPKRRQSQEFLARLAVGMRRMGARSQ